MDLRSGMTVPTECGPGEQLPVRTDAQIRKWIAKLARHCQSLEASWRHEVAEEAGAVGCRIGQRPDDHGVANGRWRIDRPDIGQRIGSLSPYFDAKVGRILAFAAIERVDEPNAEPRRSLSSRHFLASLTANDRDE